MSKFRNPKLKTQVSSKKQKIEEKLAYRSVIISAILAGIFLFISFLFNAIPFFMEILMNQNIFLDIVDITIKTVLILLFFLFSLVSIGNYKDLTGKPLDFKIIIVLFIISLIQAFRNPWVLFFTFLGLVFILVYLYFTQES